MCALWLVLSSLGLACSWAWILWLGLVSDRVWCEGGVSSIDSPLYWSAYLLSIIYRQRHLFRETMTLFCVSINNFELSRFQYSITERNIVMLIFQQKQHQAYTCYRCKIILFYLNWLLSLPENNWATPPQPTHLTSWSTLWLNQVSRLRRLSPLSRRPRTRTPPSCPPTLRTRLIWPAPAPPSPPSSKRPPLRRPPRPSLASLRKSGGKRTWKNF